MAEGKNNNEASKKAVAEQKARIQAEKEFGQSLTYAQSALMEQVKALKQQQGLVEGLIRSSKVLNDSTKQNAELKNDLSSLYSTELQTANDVVLKRAMVNTQLRGEYAQYLAQYMIQHKGNKEMMKRLPSIVEELKKRQELNKKLEEERDLYEEVAAKTLEIRNEAEAYKQSLKKIVATAAEIAKDPKTLGAFALSQGIKAVGEFNEGFKELRHQGLTAGQAIEGKFKTMTMDSMLGLSDTEGALKGFVAEYGNINAVSQETLDSVGHMAHEFGIAGEAAAKLHAQMSKMPGETEETATHAMEATFEFAKSKGLSAQMIQQDLAENTTEMARAAGKGAEQFGKSAVKLREMGTSMTTMSKVADALLDYESSMAAQMEASVILGKEINLDKARQLALNNETEALGAEMLKQIGSSANFAKMNRLEQDIYAKSVNMTIPEMQQMLDAQEKKAKYSGEDAGNVEKMLGYIMEKGGVVAGIFQKHGMLIMVMVQLMTSVGGMQLLNNIRLGIGNGLLIAKNVILGIGQGIMMTMVFLDNLLLKGIIGRGVASTANFIKEQAQFLWRKMTENTLFGQWMANMAARRSARIAEAAQEKALAAKGKVPKVTPTPKGGAGAGAGKGLRGLAGGLKAMGSAKVLFGAFNLAVAATGLLLMVAALPFLFAISGLGVAAGAGLKSLASGIKSFGNPKTLFGAGVMAAVAAATAALGAATMLFAAGGAGGTALMIASLIALTVALVVLGSIAPVGFIGVALVLAVGIAMVLLGVAVVLAAIGLSIVVDALIKLFEVLTLEKIGLLFLLGPAMMAVGLGALVLAAGFLVAAPALLLFGIAAALSSIGIAALGVGLIVLGAGVMVVSLGFQMLSEVLSIEFIESLASLIPVAAGLSLSLLALGAAAFFASPGLIIGSFALGLLGSAMSLFAVSLVAATPGIALLMQLGDMAGAFADIAVSIGAMAAGIVAFAVGGLLTLPTILGLMALAVVAPVLVALGESINYDLGGGESAVESTPKEDKMDILISEIRELRASVDKGGVINMDGKKVGDAIRLRMSGPVK